MSDQQPRWLISGGIGSGKSAVRRLLEANGFHAIDADSIGHEVLAQGGPAYRSVAARWPQVVDANGDIDRAELGRIVFSDEAELHELEGITHPHIFGTIRERIQGIPDPVAVEIPLLRHDLKGTWSSLIVDCDDQIRHDRLLAKGMTEEDARARMAAQPTRAQWLAVADITIPNHQGAAELEDTLTRLLQGMARPS